MGLVLGPSARLRLAVLPFVCLPHDAALDLFTDGLTEEAIIQLAQACPPHIGVIARTSVMSALVHSAADAGRALGADYLVEGSVRREGDRLRIVAQLIESQGQTHLWAASFDRVVGDGLAVQTDVAEQIAQAVAGALSAREPLLSREAVS
jgi:TolB-like protein